jgi:perosamine synthetase
MYAIVVEPQFNISRDELAAYLSAQGIETRTFFCPMNQQPFLRAQEGYRDVSCPVADRLWQTGLYLPSANHLDEPTIARVCEAIRRAPHR